MCIKNKIKNKNIEEYKKFTHHYAKLTPNKKKWCMNQLVYLITRLVANKVFLIVRSPDRPRG
jgi:hypothetical protein